MKNAGISLIVLVITIIVIIILAGAVILSLANNNPIMSANEAKFRSDMHEVQNQLNLYMSSKFAETLGTYDINTMDGEVSTFVPGVTQYDTDFDIIDGKLKYTGTDNQILIYVRGMNFDITTKYEGIAEIVKPNVINKTEGTLEAWVNVTSTMRNETADKYIFSTYADEKYTNTLALRHTRDNAWQAIMSSDYNQVTDISVADTLNEGWHLFSLKWNSTEFSLFIDGAKVATTASPKLMQAVSTNMYIGSGPKLNLVRNGYISMGNNTNFTDGTYITSDYNSLTASLSATGDKGVFTSDYIKIDSSKSYTLLGSLKSIGTSGNSFTYFGFATYDSDKQYIGPMMSSHYANTETELVQDLKPGDTVVYLKDATNWKKSADWVGHRYFAMYPYKDYPVYTYTRNFYTFNDSNTTNNTLTLSSPYSGALVKSGTKVANNYNNNGEYTYSAVCAVYVPNTWTKYTAVTSGQAVNYGGYDKFRYGTKYIKPLLLLNYNQSSSYTTLFDDIEFKDNANTIYNSKIQELCISNVARTDNEILNRYASGILSKDSNVTFMLTEQ